MDMPEGWKRFNTFTSTGIDKSPDKGSIFSHLEEGAELIKEMAEALEHYSLFNKEGIPFNVVENTETEKMVVAVNATYFNKSHKILKKFKDWK